jgi:hypothetical protein
MMHTSCVAARDASCCGDWQDHLSNAMLLPDLLRRSGVSTAGRAHALTGPSSSSSARCLLLDGLQWQGCLQSASLGYSQHKSAAVALLHAPLKHSCTFGCASSTLQVRLQSGRDTCRNTAGHTQLLGTQGRGGRPAQLLSYQGCLASPSCSCRSQLCQLIIIVTAHLYRR